MVLQQNSSNKVNFESDEICLLFFFLIEFCSEPPLKFKIDTAVFSESRLFGKIFWLFLS